MDKVLERIKSKFLYELNSEGDFWRIYRRNTFIDLIVRDFVKFQRSQESDLLIDIFNQIIKMRMQGKLNKIDLTQDFNSLTKMFGQNENEVIHLYNKTLNSIVDVLDYSNAGSMENNVLYFKVASNLNLNEYNEGVLDELLSNIYSFLLRNAQ